MYPPLLFRRSRSLNRRLQAALAPRVHLELRAALRRLRALFKSNTKWFVKRNGKEQQTNNNFTFGGTIPFQLQLFIDSAPLSRISPSDDSIGFDERFSAHEIRRRNEYETKINRNIIQSRELRFSFGDTIWFEILRRRPRTTKYFAKSPFRGFGYRYILSPIALQCFRKQSAHQFWRSTLGQCGHCLTSKYPSQLAFQAPSNAQAPWSWNCGGEIGTVYFRHRIRCNLYQAFLRCSRQYHSWNLSHGWSYNHSKEELFHIQS